MNNKKIKYIYILSQRYSGSTLLSFLLSTHDAISSIGERRKFYNKSVKTQEFLHHKARYCSCGEKFENCSFLNEIKDEVLSKIDHRMLRANTTEFNIYKNKYFNRIAYEISLFLYSSPLFSQLNPFSKRIRDLKRFNEHLVKAILKATNTSAFLDSSKAINHTFFLSQIEAFDFHIIRLIRDPRAQVNSAMKYNNWTVEKATEMWINEMNKNEKTLQKMKLKILNLRYEDLCREPKSELRSLYDFVGLDSSNVSLDFRDTTRHIIGNGKMRLGDDKAIKERTEWKNELTNAQISKIEGLTADFTQFYSD